MGRAKNMTALVDGFDSALGSRRGWHAPAQGIFAPPGTPASRKHATKLKELWDEGHYTPLWKTLSSQNNLRQHPQALALLSYGVGQWAPDMQDPDGAINEFLICFDLRTTYCKKIVAVNSEEMHIPNSDETFPFYKGVSSVRMICGTMFDNEDISSVARGNWQLCENARCEGCEMALQDYDDDFIGAELYETVPDNQFLDPAWQSRFESEHRRVMISRLITALEESSDLTQDEAEEIAKASAVDALMLTLEKQMQSESYAMLENIFSQEPYLFQSMMRKIISYKINGMSTRAMNGALKAEDFSHLYNQLQAEPLNLRAIRRDFHNLITTRADEICKAMPKINS